MTSLLHRTVSSGVTAGVYRRFFDPDSEPDGHLAITEDELFELLADSRRRAVIDRLAGFAPGESTTVGTLAKAIAATETNMPSDRLREERVRPVSTELARTHLPLLADAGLVRWERETDEVAPGHALDSIAEWLNSLNRHVEPDRTSERHHRADVSRTLGR